MAGERLEIIHVRAENERLAGEDGLGGILAAGGEKGFPDDDRIRVGGPGGELAGGALVGTGPTPLSGVGLDLGDVGELAPVVAAVAALAETPSRLTGIAHLRGHETDRLAAIATEFTRLGGDVEELDDGLEIRPRPLHGDVFRTYHDHRMAHAAVVLGLRVPDIFVENVVTTVKTYPNFAPVWERLVDA